LHYLVLVSTVLSFSFIFYITQLEAKLSEQARESREKMEQKEKWHKEQIELLNRVHKGKKISISLFSLKNNVPRTPSQNYLLGTKMEYGSPLKMIPQFRTTYALPASLWKQTRIYNSFPRNWAFK
jgi:hypothetical protein